MKHAAPKKHVSDSFSEFLDDTLVGLSILVIGLVTLVFSIMEFTQVVKY